MGLGHSTILAVHLEIKNIVGNANGVFRQQAAPPTREILDAPAGDVARLSRTSIPHPRDRATSPSENLIGFARPWIHTAWPGHPNVKGITRTGWRCETIALPKTSAVNRFAVLRLPGGVQVVSNPFQAKVSTQIDELIVAAAAAAIQIHYIHLRTVCRETWLESLELVNIFTGIHAQG